MRIGQEAFYRVRAEECIELRDRGEATPFDLDEVGRLLRSAREAKGITYEEIEIALFISKKSLRAIESGDWNALPPTVYVRGYVAQYASFLGILDMVEPELSWEHRGTIVNK
jgi:hypothetical protein